MLVVSESKNEVENSKKLLLLCHQIPNRASKQAIGRKLCGIQNNSNDEEAKETHYKEKSGGIRMITSSYKSLTKLPYNNPSFHVPSKQQSKKHKENNTDA